MAVGPFLNFLLLFSFPNETATSVLKKDHLDLFSDELTQRMF